MFRVRYFAVTYKFSFFFNLVGKNSLRVKKISKCRENGIDRLRNGQLLRLHIIFLKNMGNHLPFGKYEIKVVSWTNTDI